MVISVTLSTDSPIDAGRAEAAYRIYSKKEARGCLHE
jgi:hypothetical protein